MEVEGELSLDQCDWLFKVHHGPPPRALGMLWEASYLLKSHMLIKLPKEKELDDTIFHLWSLAHTGAL